MIGAASARRREARLFGVAVGAPLVTMQRTTYEQSGRAVEFASHVYPADRYRFELGLVTH